MVPVIRISFAFLFAGLFFAPARSAGADQLAANSRLKVAVAQMAFAPTLAGNRDRIISGVAEAARKGARVAVFPEGALNARAGDAAADVEEAIASIGK